MDSSEAPECSSAYIASLKFDKRCEAVRLHCLDPNSLVDFPLVHYCWLKEASFVSIPLMVLPADQILFVLIVFSLIGFVCEEHISSAIARLSKRLRIPEAIAGATLLALANGASDIMTVIIASKAHNSSVDLAIGSLFGANIYVGTVVLAAIINYSNLKAITELANTHFEKDILFFVGGILIFIVLASLNLIPVVTGVAMLTYYGLFVHSVISSALNPPKRHHSIDDHAGAPLQPTAVAGQDPLDPLAHPAPQPLRASLAGSTFLGGESVRWCEAAAEPR